AHEAIRPSDVNTLAEQLTGMDKDEVRLYDLILASVCRLPNSQRRNMTVQRLRFTRESMN
ncbi:DNA topoisomerase I, partial [Pasteurella multocida subsp. multocida str. Anand1_cattle]